MSFNKEQQEAILASTNEDILISAGAGSGKTKTLSVRVNKIINDSMISPSELLVLTFTNNAAHEMKERIIASFKNDNNEFANEILSSHVQTFDSFAQYLVTTYSARLGISDKVSIVLEELIESKRRQLLDDILDTYYNDEDKFNRIKETIAKLSNRNDEPLKKIVLDLSSSLGKLPLYQREEILNNYDSIYFTKEFFINTLDDLVKEEKLKVKKAFIEAYLIDKNYRLFMESDDPEILKSVFKKESLSQIKFDLMSFNESHVQDLYEKIRFIDQLDSFSFIATVQKIREEGKMKKEKGASEEETYLFETVYLPLSYLFFTENAKLIGLMSFEDEENEFNKYLSFKDDIHLIIDIVKELDTRIQDYKLLTNSFTFQDIQNMALSLVNDPKYEDIADEIRRRFKYIMVDEYQDTNDFQETFINALLKEDENGNRAHLFCVGDAKQAIYGFRGSNVALFKNRQKQYEDGKDGHRVINMNKNYRSAKKLLKDINYIFSYYMTYGHGGIDYLKPLEQLDYDDEVDLYGKAPYDHFGIYRLIPMRYKENGIYKKERDGLDDKEWEMDAIINDIKEKVESGFLIYDRSYPNHLRPAMYRDFVILTRGKAPFKEYQEGFKKNNIPLNNKLATNLIEADAVILLQSLISLLSYKVLNENIDVRHVFTSIARSYAFQYSDNYIYQLLKDNDPEMINNDEIMLRMDDLIKKSEGQSFINIFTMLLDEFDVINKLYLIGDVADNIAKIESFYTIILNEQRAGEGLKEFLTLLKNVDKYDLKLKDETNVSLDNAVSIMTIHASKGLENKIVYMPVTQNKIITGSNFNKADYYFSKEYGIQLPYYHIDLNKKMMKGEEEIVAPSSVSTIPYLRLANLNNIDAERDEHVRLFYVALTRAENALYIVGEPKADDNKENLYGMLNFLPHFRRINTGLIEKAKKVIPEINNLYSIYLKYTKLKTNDVLPFVYQDFINQEDYLIYAEIYKKLVSDAIDKKIDSAIKDIENAIIMYTHDEISKHKDDIDYLAMINLRMLGVDNVNTFKGMRELWFEMKDEQYFLLDKKEIAETEGQIKEYLLRTTEALIKGLPEEFGIKVNKNDDPIYAIYHHLFMNICYAFFKTSWLDKISYYQEGRYDDKEEYYQHQHTLEDELNKAVELLYLTPNDEEIIFPIRERHRASHMATMHDEDISNILAFGTKMHRYMELVDFNTKDTSFIKDMKARKRIDKVLSLPLFNDLSNTRIYKEYGYYDELLNTTGFIDLLMQKGDEFIIVDYKLRNISYDTYEDQLNTYRRNIASIFDVEEKSIKVMLISLLTGEVEIEN